MDMRSITEFPVRHNPSSQADGHAEVGRDRAERAAAALRALGSELTVELLLDAAALKQDEALTLDEIYDLARRTAREAAVVLEVAARLCVRCDGPLMTWADRQSGLCEPCRENRRVIVAMLADELRREAGRP